MKKNHTYSWPITTAAIEEIYIHLNRSSVSGIWSVHSTLCQLVITRRKKYGLIKRYGLRFCRNLLLMMWYIAMFVDKEGYGNNLVVNVPNQYQRLLLDPFRQVMRYLVLVIFLSAIIRQYSKIDGILSIYLSLTCLYTRRAWLIVYSRKPAEGWIYTTLKNTFYD